MIALSLITIVSAWAARAPDYLSFDVSAGKVPLHVTVSGPPLLLQKAKDCKHSYGGVGFTLNWGDGTREDTADCSKMLSHVYTVPGTYMVSAKSYRPGPTDAPITEWEGQAKIVSLKAGSLSKLEIKIVESPAGEAIHFGSGFPTVKAYVQTSRKLELKSELVSKEGKVLFSASEEVGNSGEVYPQWNKYGDGPAAEAYKDGKIFAKVRLSLVENGKVLESAESAPFTLLGSITFREFSVSSVEGKAPFTVTAVNAVSYADCYSFIVDWGDGSPSEASGDFVPPKQCLLKSGRKELKHVFRKPGKYWIRWYDNSVNPFAAAHKGPGFMEKHMLVTQ